MPKFRKKPIVIEAMQFDPERLPLPFQEQAVCHLGVEGELINGWHVHTLEGALRISTGDWIIKGIHGEFYPCKPDIFKATYEPAD